MKPTMLVIGDSFMTKDPDYPDEHWSEMLPEYNVVNLARAGASLSWIADQLVQGLQYNPAVAVVGLTETSRLTFIDNDNVSRYSTCHTDRMTSDEKLLYTLWLASVPWQFKYVSAITHISFIFETLRKQHIPFVWHKVLFSTNYVQPAHSKQFEFVFDEYAKTELTQDIWAHKHVDRPKFHIDNREWQVEFANNVRTLLTKTK